MRHSVKRLKTQIRGGNKESKSRKKLSKKLNRSKTLKTMSTAKPVAPINAVMFGQGSKMGHAVKKNKNLNQLLPSVPIKLSAAAKDRNNKFVVSSYVRTDSHESAILTPRGMNE